MSDASNGWFDGDIAAQYLLQEAAERMLSLEEDTEDIEDEEQAGTSHLYIPVL